MRKLKEVLRLRLTAKLSNRKIALITGVGKTAVSKHVRRAMELGLDWGRIEGMAEEAIAALLYSEPEKQEAGEVVLPDWDEVARELRRKGVTLPKRPWTCCACNNSRAKPLTTMSVVVRCRLIPANWMTSPSKRYSGQH